VEFYQVPEGSWQLIHTLQYGVEEKQLPALAAFG
jgi:hypothetical protein